MTQVICKGCGRGLLQEDLIHHSCVMSDAMDSMPIASEGRCGMDVCGDAKHSLIAQFNDLSGRSRSISDAFEQISRACEALTRDEAIRVLRAVGVLLGTDLREAVDLDGN